MKISYRSQGVVCFVTVKPGRDHQDLQSELRQQIRAHIGPFATPKRIIIVSDLPKTRSGKIMRRILRKVACGEVTSEDAETKGGVREKLGDISTLADESVVLELIQAAAAVPAKL